MRILRAVVLSVVVVAVTATTGCQATVVDETVPTDYNIEQADRADMPEEIREIFDSGRLTLGTKFDQPLTGLRDEATGRIEGFDAEIGRIVAQRIFGTVAEGDNLDFIETVSGKRETYLDNGTVDLVIGTYTMTSGRQKEVAFAGPYYEANQAIMTRKGSDIKELKDLNGKKVCTAEGSTSPQTLKQKNKKADVSTPLRTYSACTKALLEKRYDAVSTDDVILHGFRNEEPTKLVVSDESFSTEPYGIGMAKKSKGMRDFINDSLKMAFKNGDWQTAFDKTLGAADVPQPSIPKIGKG